MGIRHSYVRLGFKSIGNNFRHLTLESKIKIFLKLEFCPSIGLDVLISMDFQHEYFYVLTMISSIFLLEIGIE